MTVQLDLLINSPNQFDKSVRPTTTAISRAKYAPSSIGGIIRKLGYLEYTSLPIPAGNERTGNNDFADFTIRNAASIISDDRHITGGGDTSHRRLLCRVP